MTALMVVGCGEPAVDPNENKQDNPGTEIKDNDNPDSGNKDNDNPGGGNEDNPGGGNQDNPGGGNQENPPVDTHTHSWGEAWEYDSSKHWHNCSGCKEKNSSAAHTFGEYQDIDLGTLLNNPKYKYTVVRTRKCSVCDYLEYDQSKASILPEFRVTFDSKDPHANFATVAKSTDVNRPKVNANFSITNVESASAVTNKPGTIKVRGNQTAGFPKKGFTLKFESKISLLGLGGGQKFKKWVLMADAKDCTCSRTALGLTMSEGIIRDDSKVWSSEYTPVSLYLNDQYWGMYFLAEQKESKSGRINLPEVEDDYDGVDIGYCFELDHYAEEEPKKNDGGDPTFTIKYDGYENSSGGMGMWGQQNNPYDIESTLANPGLMTHFTMNSDITDGPAQPSDEAIEAGTAKGTPVNANNSNQVKFIQDRVTALFKVLKKGAVDKQAYTINSSNQAVAASGKTVRQAIEENFDLKAWAEGFIINAIACPPDVGYSSFYMSFDNSPKGDKKLRFDCPWDFDSNFGNRSQLCEGGDSGSKDPYYLDRTSNMWLQCLSKLDFFITDYVKPLWNAVREEKVFENCIDMLKVYYQVYANEYKKNFTKWTSINPDDPNVSSYFGGELRSVFKQVDESSRKKAQTETINWFSKRVNYFEKKWGQNRASLPTIQ